MICAMTEVKPASLSDRVLLLLEEINRSHDAVYAELVRLMAETFEALNGQKHYVPVSAMRELCRHCVKDLKLEPADQLLFHRASADAILSAMTASSAPDAVRMGRELKRLLHYLDKSHAGAALVLRLRHVVGLTWDEIVEFPRACKEIGDPAHAASSLAAELKACGLSPEALSRQNLRPRGEVTRLLEKVRDGRLPLGDVVAHEQLRLQRLAEHLLRLEGKNISLQPDDLVNELFLRLPRDPAKSPEIGRAHV